MIVGISLLCVIVLGATAGYYAYVESSTVSEQQSENEADPYEEIKGRKGCFIKNDGKYFDVTLDIKPTGDGRLFLTTDGTAKVLGLVSRPASDDEYEAAKTYSEREQMLFSQDTSPIVIENTEHSMLLIPGSRLCMFDKDVRMLPSAPLPGKDGSLYVPFQTIAFMFGYNNCKLTIDGDLSVYNIK